MVTMWILNSINKKIANIFLHVESAVKLWKALNKRYGSSSGPLIYQLEKEILDITQGNNSVTGYFNKLSRCWDDLDSIKEVYNCTCRNCTRDIMDKIAQDRDRSKAIQFLIKLNHNLKV